MAIPPFQYFFLPFLTFIADGEEYTKQDLAEHLAKTFNLSQEDVDEVLPSGRQTRFMNRVAWTRTYLGKAILVESSGRGRFRITQRGRELLATNPTKLDIRTLKQFPEFQAFHQANTDDTGGNSTDEQVVAGETPEERLESSYQALRKELAQALLQQVLNASPAFFEQLVVDLLVAMGYGGSRADAGKAVGQSGDEGIDGIIKEDRLGLDIIYLQAKRWQNPVGRPQVQAFVGSLVGKGAGKGVMLTTSRFTDDARQFVRHLQQKVVLIDGEELTGLMIDFNVGVAATTQYVVKKIDLDYFGEE
ncbi:restriction endonuclease [Paraburkholderia sp. BR10936]|uniref:restriction endonuclease n=1 Tax=Paraburkholderia sp. BR10936 TaxID=3236993 RepID=UPI0034D19329